MDPEAVCFSVVTRYSQFSLEWFFVRAQGRVGKDLGEPQKGDCCGFSEADGAVYQMGV